MNAEWALRTVVRAAPRACFDEFTDAYLRERTHRPRRRARPHPAEPGRGDATRPPWRGCPGSFVLVAADLTPSEAAELDWERVLAVVTDAGSATYHTAILARSLGVPAVVGLRDATRRIPPGALVVVDGTRGRGGGGAGGARARQLPRGPGARAARGGAPAGARGALPAVTRDGVRVAPAGERGVPREAATARALRGRGHRPLPLRVPAGPRAALADGGAAGRGLPPAARADARRTRSPCAPGTWASRTWRPAAPRARTRPWASAPCACCGATPSPSAPSSAPCCARRRTARCASCSPSSTGPARPAAGPRPAARRRATRCAARACRSRDDVPVGLNLEVPSAALTGRPAGRRRGLLQRSAPTTSSSTCWRSTAATRACRGLYQPLHPAVLRTARGRWCAAAAARGCPSRVCGEMAADPLHALLLVGLGVRELSMSPGRHPAREGGPARGAAPSQLREVARGAASSWPPRRRSRPCCARELAEVLAPLAGRRH